MPVYLSPRISKYKNIFWEDIMRKVVSISIIALFFMALASLNADVPKCTSYQGYLTDPSGNPVADDVYDITFKIYGSVSGPDLLWSSGVQAVQVTGGTFTYLLGSNVPFPDDLWVGDSTRYLGITVGADPEIIPRTKFTTSVFAGHAAITDKIMVPAILQMDDDINWTLRVENSGSSGAIYGVCNAGYAGFFDGNGLFTGDLTIYGDLDAPGLGDITAVTAGDGLDGGGTSGDVQLSVEPDGITSNHIQNNSIMNTDINTSANIAPSKIQGTAAVLNGVNTFEASNTFNDTVTLNDAQITIRNGGLDRWYIRQSMGLEFWQKYDAAGELQDALSMSLGAGLFFLRDMTISLWRDGAARWSFIDSDTTGLQFYQVSDNQGVYQYRTIMEIGDSGTIGIGEVDSESRLNVKWDLNTSAPKNGQHIYVVNQDNGFFNGLRVDAEHPNVGAGGSNRGVYATSTSDGYSRTGLEGLAQAKTLSLSYGSSVGVMGTGYDGSVAYGVYGQAGYANTNWAGWFQGNCRVTGTFDNSKSSMRIDHPSDPENKVLEHATVNAPEMLNVYSGNVITDASGEAVVQLPDYLEALNTDFRYQLTCIGGYSRVYVAEEIANNQFKIAGAEPGRKISWQVTGVRKDAFAQAHPVVVESEKSAEEKGYYINPEAFGLDVTRSTEYVSNPEFKRHIDERREQK
jgi:hypothetical protein